MFQGVLRCLGDDGVLGYRCFGDEVIFGQKKPPINGGTANSRNQQISCFSSLPLQDSILIFLYNTKNSAELKKKAKSL
jgi:hypothetical protein